MVSISVVIPLYNKEKHIKRALKSVLSQSFQDFEIVVVNDGSTDKGAEKVYEIDDRRIKLINQPNKGVSAARNRGIQEARYDYVAFLDADDAWKPEFLETIQHLIENCPQAGLYATAYETCHFKTGVTKITYRSIPPEPWEGIIPEFFDSMLGQPPVWTSAAVVKKNVFKVSGYFAEGEVIGEDVDMWCRVALKYPIAFSTKVCATYYLDSDNRCYVRGSKHKKATGYLQTLNNAIEDPTVSESNRINITRLKEMVEIGYASSLILGYSAQEARAELKSYKLKYLDRQKTFWYLISFLPVKLIELMMDIKAKMKK